MAARFLGVFAGAPVLFFGVVIGVALVFRLGVGAVRDAATPEPVAPTFVTGAGPRSSAGAAAAEPPRLHADPSASALPSPTPAAEVGAAAKVQPLGSPSSPPPVRIAPRPRGHGRRPVMPVRGGNGAGSDR